MKNNAVRGKHSRSIEPPRKPKANGLPTGVIHLVRKRKGRSFECYEASINPAPRERLRKSFSFNPESPSSKRKARKAAIDQRNTWKLKYYKPTTIK